MIVRSHFKCLTCGQTHTVRIGMGQEEYQSHRFPCMGCGEEIAIGMHVDYEKLGWRIEAIENAEHAVEEPDAPIVNVDANFIIPEKERHKDFAFPRLLQMRQMSDAAEKDGALIFQSAIPSGMLDERPFRRPDFAAEWQLLKKAWSLHRRGRNKLSVKEITEASTKYYASEPLNDLLDWMWRFTTLICQPSYEPKFRAAFEVVNSLVHLDRFDTFKRVYDAHLAQERSSRYFDLMRDHFLAFAEFGQVHFLVSNGLEIAYDNAASSVGFQETRMFYGNAFEDFAFCVDILAYLNNIAMGRHFDKFDKLTRQQYLQLDKSSRFTAFSMNVPFITLCEERDNQLRNASHHGSFQFDQAKQLITYRSGKGGTGPVQRIGYAAYLAKCTRIFLQAMTLLRTEIMMCHLSGARPPF